MSTYLAEALRQELENADDACCVYCQTAVANTGQPLTVDHIVPQGRGGLTIIDNLCFACRRCNEFKGSTTHAADPLTGKIVAIFHPRQNKWNEHFAWDETRTHIAGMSATGRATVAALRMNNEFIVDARRRWVSAGWHPPRPKS